MRMSTKTVGRPILRASEETGAANLPFCDGSTAPLTVRMSAAAYARRSISRERCGPGAPGTPASCRRASRSAAVASAA